MKLHKGKGISLRHFGIHCAVSRPQPTMGGVRFGGMGSATSSTISNGSLVVDIYDPTTKQLVWTGTATKTLDPSSNQEKNQKNLDKAMAKLLKNYPPPQKK